MSNEKKNPNMKPEELPQHDVKSTASYQVLDACDDKNFNSAASSSDCVIITPEVRTLTTSLSSTSSGDWKQDSDVTKSRQAERSLQSQQKMQAKAFPLSRKVLGVPGGKIYSSYSSSENLVVTVPKSGHKSKLEKAKKPGYGQSKKREIRIVTNFFPLLSKQQDIYHYDVDIFMYTNQMKDNRKPLSTELSRTVIFEFFKLNADLQQYTPIFDGKKNLFTAKRMRGVEDKRKFEIPLALNGREKTFYLTVQPVRKRHTNDNAISSSLLEDYTKGNVKDLPEEIRLVYEAVLSYRKLDSPQVKLGMSFFTLQQNSRKPLGDGLEILQGYNQNIRFTETGAAVVINVATSAFHKSGPIIDYIGDILRKKITSDSSFNNNDIKKLNKVLRGVRIDVTHDRFKRKYYIQEIISCLPRDHKFEMDGKLTSVEDYFRNIYHYNLKYKRLPLLEMRKGKQVRMPIEVCNVVPGQRFPSRNLEGKKKTDMIRYTAVPPEKKFKEIESYAESASRINSSILSSYGMKMDLEPVSFSTRVLQQPEIKYASCVVRPNEQGMWEVRQSYFISVKSQSWRIISFTNPYNKQALDKLSNFLCRASNKVGLLLPCPDIVDCSRITTENVLNDAKRDGMQFVVVVLSKLDFEHTYEEIKFIADIKLNLACQCVDQNLIQNAQKFNERVAAYICLKINTKLEGINHTLSEWPLALEKEVVFIIGADVVHSLDLDCSSIAAVVGCVDYNAWKYAVSCRALSNPKQNGKNQEIILTLKEMVVTLLMAYYKNTRRKPEKILFYRDGVSEGQFQKALDSEIPMIKEACQSLQDSVYQPPITFVVVQKRIQPRFKPENPRDGVGRMGNAPPGTVIDQHIVDPINFDFYLVSHEGIQGTSKPIYYTVLFDENGVQPDVIQRLTFYLCHMFASCTRSISIPAPVKYADLLAYRAMNYVKAIKPRGFRGGRYSQCQDKVPLRIEDLLKDIEKIQNKMFFI